MEKWPRRRQECHRELTLGLLAQIWIVFALWGPVTTSAIWRCMLFCNWNERMDFGEARNVPESPFLVCLHIFEFCFASKGVYSLQAPSEGAVFLTVPSAESIIWSCDQCTWPNDLVTIWSWPNSEERTVLINQNARMGLGEAKNIPEGSNLVGLHFFGLCFCI